MVTVIQRPQGHKIIDQVVTANIISNGGIARVNNTGHSLTTGDTIYIVSDIEEYNGFHTVDVSDANYFQIESDFYQNAEIEYYQTQEHDWSSIFLPIVYKASTDRFPNTLESVLTVSSSQDDNGYTQLNLSGPLKTSFHALEFIKVEGHGVYQIIEVITTSQVVITLPYDPSNTFSTAQYYYNNYQVKVKIFAGLPPSHPWAAKKPYTEVGELSLTPDENGEVMFSISDYIKGNIQIRNNLTLYSLPLNLDAFTGFYISTGESYDQSDNYSLYTSESSFTTDSFKGYAVAGKLPFKNTYSGDYAEYVYTSGSPAKWLTTMERLMAVVDLYFDISFIKNIAGPFFVRFDWYIASYKAYVEDVEYADLGQGVYRIPVTASNAYDSVCVTVTREAYTAGFDSPPLPLLSDWTNQAAGGPAWTDSNSPTVDFEGLGTFQTSDVLYTAYAFEVGQTYTFGYHLSGPYDCAFVTINIYDVSMNVLATQNTAFPSPNPDIGSYTFVAPAGAVGVGLIMDAPCSCGSPGGFCVKTLVSFTNDTPSAEEQPELRLTEEICIDIVDYCDIINDAGGGSGPGGDNIQLTEDGDYQLIE